MQFGLCVATHIDNIGLIEHAERLGFDRVWVPDSQMIWSDCYATLARAAERTSRIQLGTGVAIVGTRIAPVTAHSIATINRIAPGRTFLGIGSGHTAMRVMGVLDPLPVVITNYPEGETEWVEAVNNPEDEDAGSRTVPFSRNLLIERDDFMEDPPRKFFRLAPGREVRLRWGYFIRCEEVVKNDLGEVVALHCTYDPDTKGGFAPDGRKVRGTIHWVSADHAVPAEVRLYDRLFNVEDPFDVPDGQDFMASLSPDSLSTLDDARLEPSVRELAIGQTVQFERKGYFCLDPDSAADHLVFNRTITLRDTRARIQSQTRRKGRGQR